MTSIDRVAPDTPVGQIDELLRTDGELEHRSAETVGRAGRVVAAIASTA